MGKKVDVLIDSREGKRIEFAQDYFKEKGLKTSVKRLDVADYVYKDKVAVEYKTAEDYLSSILDGRLFKQSKRMQQYPYNVILVKGNVNNALSWVERARIANGKKMPSATNSEYLGSLSSLFINGQAVINVITRKQAFELMWRIFLKSDKEKTESVERPEHKLKNKPATYLTCADYVGKNTALLVTKELNITCLEELLNIKREDLLEIKGIKEKTADRILTAIYGG
ncbi:ERCC4 domain-containing protein [Methanobrevibacter sp. DSM 116169]|uniref:ERCC4 domain-containing protein n=1 Tax=Methanobrevibacter sp. DSM 116169 TaxID=3242727 RepID=UPI0038FC483F